MRFPICRDSPCVHSGALILCLAAFSWTPGSLGAAEEPADLVLRNTAVYTLDAARSWASALAVRGGEIVYVGEDPGVESWIGPETDVRDLSGRMVLPGFQDAHIHAVASGVEVLQCDLSGLQSVEGILEEVARCAERQTGEWLVGAGWQLPVFPEANPGKELLDEVVGDRPAFLAAADGHSAWVSSEALERAGITRETPNPPNGRIERDPETGEATGTLREDAMRLVGRLVPPPPLDLRLDGLRMAQEKLLAAGVTAIQEASGDPSDLEAYREAARRGELRLEVTAAIDSDPERGPEQVEDLVDLAREMEAPGFRPSAVKIFLDGVIEARTAAMLEPYLDRPGDRGELTWPVERFRATVAALEEAGFDVHVHAIGDRAVRVALDGFEASATPAGRTRPRHQIAHLEVIHPDDVPRFRRLGVIANFQPLWAYADTYIVDLTWPALGPERSAWIYPIASVSREGGPLAFGSDWSVSSLEPLDGIEVAVTRTDPDRVGGEPMQPGERVDLPTALAAYTIGAAWANRTEERSGSVEVGKEADLVVLEKNLFEIPAEEISETGVLLTVSDGRIVYPAEGAADPASGSGGGPGGM